MIVDRPWARDTKFDLLFHLHTPENLITLAR